MNIFKELEGFVFNQFKSLKTILSIMKLESELARLSIVPLLTSAILLFIICLTLWFSTMVLMGYLISLLTNFISAMLMVILINIGLLWGCKKMLVFNLKNISFQKTRYLLKEDGHDESEKSLDKSHHIARKKIALSKKTGTKT